LIDYLLNIQNAPVWISAALVLAAAFWLVNKSFARASRKQEAQAKDLEPLTTEQAALIERALAASAERLAPAADNFQPTGADAKAMLRAALTNFLRSGDAKGRRVATLLAEKHTHEAQDLALAIASEIRGDGKSATERARAAQAWIDAGAVAYLNDGKAAIAASERARDLGAVDVVSHTWLGCLYLRRGRLGEAEAAFRTAEAALGPEENVSRAALLGNLGSVALKRGDRPAARAQFEQALAIYREMGAWEHEWARYARANLAKLNRG
jgi:Tfp pilus assembly protein PilF